MENKKQKPAPQKPAASSHLIAALIAVAVLVWLLMLVWNSLVPTVFAAPELTFRQALLLWLLPNLVLHGFQIVKWVAR